MLINVSPEYIYEHGKGIRPIKELHRPYFYAFVPKGVDIERERKRLIEDCKTSDENSELSGIQDISPVLKMKSFSNLDKTIDVFKVFVRSPGVVPKLSDRLFNMGFYTGEHDIPYQQRALVDLSVFGGMWPFDTRGREEQLNCMCYDIETLQFAEEDEHRPIDILGYSDFSFKINSMVDLDKEEFSFDFVDFPEYTEDKEVVQLISRNEDEEIENLKTFCEKIKEYDILAGHNLLSFDNQQVWLRIKWFLNSRAARLSDNDRKILRDFVERYSAADTNYYFGRPEKILVIYPSSFDTYHAAKKFYRNLDEYSLKSIAPFLGISIKGRIYLDFNQLAMDDRTLLYNKHDVIEETGAAGVLLQQALPLAFTTGIPLEDLLTSGAVRMWDHMALVRGALKKKLMPALCRAHSVAGELYRRGFRGITRREIADRIRTEGLETCGKDFLRVVKYGEEMPEWTEYSEIIYGKGGKEEDMLGYHIPGGMTLKPDSDLKSHFIPWYKVVVADVGAMYPTILKAINAGADTVFLARPGEKPDSWVWLKRLSNEFLDSNYGLWRGIEEKEDFADKGIMVGVKISKDPGLVNLAMGGILSLISKVKTELKNPEIKKDQHAYTRLKQMYQSLKGARNAGTHGILCAPLVSSRQFNLWGAAHITTTGQKILNDVLKTLKDKNIRVVYGDTDGLNSACSRSALNLPGFARALDVKGEEKPEFWITQPEVTRNAIEECNKKWKNSLNYQDFELEIEEHDAMMLVKHKNYLIFDEINGKFSMVTKGNNFKGSDKPDIARIALERIMKRVLKENLEWESETVARENVKRSIRSATKELVAKLDLSRIDLNELTVVQSVQPSGRYKPTPNGSTSVYGERSKALETLLGEPIQVPRKFKFVITKRPLPGISHPTKSGIKPIDFMFPVEQLKDKDEIDLKWYKEMVENYINGAFGLAAEKKGVQTGLAGWM
jgi:DNA polymerase elongation subunit (family B)